MKFRPQFSIANLLLISITIGCALGWYFEWRKHAEDTPTSFTLRDPKKDGLTIDIVPGTNGASITGTSMDEIRFEFEGLPYEYEPFDPKKVVSMRIYLPTKEGK